MIEKGEEDVLEVTDDLSFDSEACRTSALDTKREVDLLRNDFAILCKELESNSSNQDQEISSLAHQYSNMYYSRLQSFIRDNEESMAMLNKVYNIMNRKVKYISKLKYICLCLIHGNQIIIIAEYFGEQSNGDQPCDSSKIFSVLQQFKVALECSKNNVNKKIRNTTAV